MILLLLSFSFTAFGKTLREKAEKVEKIFGKLKVLCMGVPKSRVSRMRGRRRRAHWKIPKPNLTPCPNCGQPKLPHRACPWCNSYKDMIVEEGKGGGK